MKKYLQLLIVALMTASFSASAQQLYWEENGELSTSGQLVNIAKSDATNLSTNLDDWFVFVGNIANQQVTTNRVAASTLTVTDYPSSGTGNSFYTSTLTSSGSFAQNNIEYNRRIGNPSGSQTLYFSTVLSIFQVRTDAPRFPFGFVEIENDDVDPSSITRTWASRVIIDKLTGDAQTGTYQVGISKDGTNFAYPDLVVDPSKEFDTGDVIVVVMKLTLDGDDTNGTDIVELFVSPSVPISEPTTWDATIATGADASVNGVFIREKMDGAKSVQDPFVDFGHIRVADSWVGLFGGASTDVTSINVTSENDINSVIIGEDPLQFSAEVLPVDATIATVTWSVLNDINGSGGEAEITASGLVTGTVEGTIRVTASANDASGITGTFDLSVETFVDPLTGSATPTAGATLPAGEYELIFSDEFEDATVNPFKWEILESASTRGPRPEIGIDDWFWKSDNVRETGGSLELDVDKFDANTMYTGAIYSNDKFKLAFGYYEVSIKIAETSKGTHTAFWLQGDNMSNVDGSGRDGAEIDVFESAWVDDITKSVVHIDGYGGDQQSNTKQYTTTDLHDGNFHAWGFLWEPDKMTIYYDGTEAVTYTDPKWIPQVEEFLWLSTGASFGFNSPGEVADFTFSSESIGKLTSATVDYIRVWKNIDLTPVSVYSAEAEDFITGGGSFGAYDPIKNVCDNASGSQAVFMQGSDESHNDRFIGFNDITISEAGVYNLEITYYTAAKALNPLEINVNGTTYTEDFAQTGTGFCSTGVHVATFPLDLLAGTNVIQFSPVDCSNGDGDCENGPYLDKIEILTRATGVDVTAIEVSSENDVTSIVDGATLQLSTVISPEFASDPSAAWSVSTSDTGAGSVNVSGLFTAEASGTVTVTATANDGSSVTGDIGLTITDSVFVTGVTITTGIDPNTIEDFEYLELTADVLPANATDNSFTWSIVNETGIATITTDGIVVSHRAGTIKAVATANDGSGILDEVQLTIAEPTITNLIYKTEAEFGTLTNSASTNDNATCDNVSGNGWVKLTDNDIAQLNLSNVYVPSDGTYQLDITYFSADTGDPVVIDLLVNDTDFANSTEESFTSIGFCQNVAGAGLKSVFVILNAGVANEIIFRNTGVSSTVEPLLDFIEIKKVPVSSIIVSSDGDATSVLDDQMLQFSAEVLPAETTDPSISWSVTNGTGEATIDDAGLLTAVTPGDVVVAATSDDNPAISGTFDLTVEDILTETITVTTQTNNTQVVNGNTLQMIATVAPANTTNPNVTWSVTNDTGSASIAADGVLTATGDGLVTVTATAADGSSVEVSLEIEIIVNEVLVQSVTISSAGDLTAIDQFEILQLTANTLPTDATNKSVTWSVDDEAIATVSNDGLLTAKVVGLVTITATANDTSGESATFELTINEALVTAISVTAGGSAELVTGATLQLTVTLTPEEVTDPSVTWSVTDGSGSASVDQSGLLTANGIGTVTVTVTANDGSMISGSLEITVTPKLVESIEVASAGALTSIDQFETLQFTATVLPSDASDKSVAWSVSDTNIASVSSDGLLTADNVGEVTIIATSTDGSGISGSFDLTIDKVLITGIAVATQSGEDQVVSGSTLQMTATTTPENVTDNTVSWGVTNGTGEATIDSNGLLAASAVGSVIVSASANDGSAVLGSLEITINAVNVPVTEINVSSAVGTSITTSQTSLMSAEVLPTDATTASVTWTTTNGTGEGSINEDGLFTAITEGTVTVVATANDESGISGSLEIVVANSVIPVTEINVTSAAGVELTTSQTSQMSVEVLPVEATDGSITWSTTNGTGEGTINEDGLFTAVSAGITTVVATANDGSTISGSLEIVISTTVIPVTEINISSAEGNTLTTDQTSQMSAEVLPADATDATVTWSVANGTGEATIAEDGLFTAVSNGTVSVIATANDGSDISASLEITIENEAVLVTEINVTSAQGISIEVGQTSQMSAAVLPAEATEQSVTWSMEGSGGSIDENGLLTGQSVGLITVIASAKDGSGITGSLEITVGNPNILVSEINILSEIGNEVPVDQTSQMSAEVLPENASDQSVTWSVSKGTGDATINQDGLLTSVAEGTVTVTATANDIAGVSGSIELSMTTILVSEVNLSAESGTEIEPGKTLKFTAEVLPADATDLTITWSVSNGTGEASVDQEGLLTGLSDGIVRVVATANDASEVSGELEITILTIDIPLGAGGDVNTGIKVYPNPVVDAFLLEVGNVTVERIELIDMTGKIVLTTSHSNQPIHISELPKASYLVRAVLNDGAVYEVRIVKK